MPRPRQATQRQRALAAAVTAGIPPDYHDRAIVLAQVVQLINRHPKMRGLVVFKGGTVMQHARGSSRFSRDVDAVTNFEPLATPKAIQKRWVEEALSTVEAQRVVRSIEPGVLRETKGFSVPVLKCNAIASPPPVTVSLSITWREPLLCEPKRAIFTLPLTNEEFDVPIVQAAEAGAEKVRAFLMRGLCRDAFDLAYYVDHILVKEDLQRLPDLVLDKLSLRPSDTDDPPSNTTLKDAFDDACGKASAAWPQGLVIAGELPSWEDVDASIQRVVRVLKGHVVPARGSRTLRPWGG